MRLLRTCRSLEVADRRMTTASKLVLAPAGVSGSTSLGHQLLRTRVLDRRPFPERGPSPRRLPLGAPRLLERLVLAEAQAAALSGCGCGALGSHSTRGTRRRRKLGRLAGDEGDGLATRTGALPPRTGPRASLLRAPRTPLAARGERDWTRPAPPLGPSVGWPWLPDRSRAAAGRGLSPTPRPAALPPQAPAQAPGGPPPPGCLGSPPPWHSAPGSRGRFWHGCGGRGAGLSPQ